MQQRAHSVHAAPTQSAPPTNTTDSTRERGEAQAGGGRKEGGGRGEDRAQRPSSGMPPRFHLSMRASNSIPTCLHTALLPPHMSVCRLCACARACVRRRGRPEGALGALDKVLVGDHDRLPSARLDRLDQLQLLPQPHVLLPNTPPRVTLASRVAHSRLSVLSASRRCASGCWRH
eukprot:3845719-Rhodomonas_salina.4